MAKKKNILDTYTIGFDWAGTTKAIEEPIEPAIAVEEVASEPNRTFGLLTDLADMGIEVIDLNEICDTEELEALELVSRDLDEIGWEFAGKTNFEVLKDFIELADYETEFPTVINAIYPLSKIGRITSLEAKELRSLINKRIEATEPLAA